MDVRNVQKTGNMHYVYLPTSWCKKYKISSDSKVSLVVNNDSSISLFPEVKTQEKKSISLILPEATPQTLIKLIMACYINPSKSFSIQLEKQTDLSKILDKKRHISALEFVELDGNNITHESSITIEDPLSLLKTMIKKIKNLVNVMITQYDEDLIKRYEEEIDRSKLLITKSVTSSLVLNEPTKLRTVHLYYLSLISMELERMVDSLIHVTKNEDVFLKKVLKLIESLKNLVENTDKLNIIEVIEFDKDITSLKIQEVKNIETYGLKRIKKHFSNISEVLFDWTITSQIEK